MALYLLCVWHIYDGTSEVMVFEGTREEADAFAAEETKKRGFKLIVSARNELVPLDMRIKRPAKLSGGVRVVEATTAEWITV